MIAREEILSALQFRYACKKFDPDKKISEQDFNLILESGRLSPSSFGFEPWRFVVIQNAELREKLRAVCWGAQGQLPTASHYVAILCRKEDMRFDAEHVTHMMRDIQKLPDEVISKKREYYRQFQQDNHLLDNSRMMFDWAVKQGYIALGNMMTIASLMGIDSCAIEGGHFDLVETILTEAQLTENGRFGLGVMAAFGYRPASVEQPIKTRQSRDEVEVWVR